MNPAHDDTKLFDKVCHKWSRVCSTCPSTCRSFPHSWLITRVTRWVSLVKQGLPILPEYPQLLVGLCCSIFSFLYNVLSFFCWPLCCLFCWFTDSDYPFGIFKLFLSVVFFGYSSFPPSIKLTATIQLNLNFWCLTPLSEIFQLYHGDQF